MQQRGSYTTMNTENEESSSPPCRGRHNSKLKVLVRSHAIREEASPPRESSPTHFISPSIKVIPSTETSPASTSPLARSSPQNNSPPQHTNERLVERSDESPKYLNKINNKQNLEKKEIASHNSNNRRKLICDCTNQSCIQCKCQERNFNNNLTNVNNNLSSNTLTVNRVNSKNKLRQQSSSQGSFDGSSSNSPCLSRDSSSEQYTDTSGADLEVFIPETINRNAKDRAFMLRIEQELVNLAKDKSKTHYKFPPMSSYQRMLVHRCAAYFGMDHNIEASGKCVVVNKTKNTRIPEVSFKDHIKDDVVFSEEPPRRSILKRDSNSIEDYCFKSPDRRNSFENRRSKSFEEREEEYAKVRRRIFHREELCFLHQMHDDANSHDEFEWTDLPHWSSADSDSSSRFRLQLPDHGRRTGRLTKVLSEETGGTSRPYVAKSYSFGGYAGVLNRGDSLVSTHSAGPRLLTKQDSGASSVSWRLSPSSSGYKSQSQMSESITPSPTSTPNQIVDSSRQDSTCSDPSQQEKDIGENRILWAVTDMNRVPKGSIIINPQTGEPYKNEDGTLYYYDPNNPPATLLVNNAATKPPPSPKKFSPQASPKKRNLSKLSSTHKSHLTNSSTSPILPYSPPLPNLQSSQQQQNRNYQFIPTGMSIDNMSMQQQQQQQQQQFPVYGTGYATPSGPEGIPFYQQPCIVYTGPYTVPMSPHFEGRMEPQPLTEMGGTYYVNMPEANTVPAQSLPYQQPPSPYWNQQPVAFYQNPPPPPPHPTNSNPPRFPVQTSNQPNYMSAFPTNYLTPPNQAPPPPPPPPPSSADLVPVFPHQSVQLVYSTQPNQANAPPLMYQNQPPNVVYTQNPMYGAPFYSTQPLPPYPQNTSTPNSVTSALSHAQFASHHMQEQSQQNMIQLTQNMSQLSFVQNQIGPNHPNYVTNKMTPPNFDIRQKTCTPRNSNKFAGGGGSQTKGGFVFGSSQSSTGTNSPAATVIAGYCPPPQNSGMYRTPPETPPNQCGYGPAQGFPVSPMLLRQMSNVRSNTPGTTRSSRSPTPANEVSYFERARVPPPGAYHGMPYAVQSENRMVSGRGQSHAYRHAAPPVKQQNFNQGGENKSQRSRRTKGNNKMPGSPITK